MANRTIRTAKNRAAILEALGEGYSVRAACQRLHLTRSAILRWRDEDAAFAAEIEAAYAEGTEALEDEALRRATQVSDTLLIFLLKGRNPDKYKERVSQQTQSEVRIVVDYTDDPAHPAPPASGADSGAG